MALIIHCPACERRVRVPDDLLGTMVRCPTCNGTFEAKPDGPPAAASDAKAEQPAGAPVEPSPEEDYRPWEHGDIRRDWEPHRGTLVMTLGILSVAIFGCPYLGIISLGLGIAAWVMGRRDLMKMSDNVMDPAGEGYTKAGWVLGIVGTCLGSLATLGCILYIGFLATMMTFVSRTPPPAPQAPVVTPAPPPPAAPPNFKGPLQAPDADKPPEDPKEKD
jgi:predicted Zn finger-like uncharacterized protein